MSQAAEKTGIGPTVVIAIEQFYPKEKRIIADDVAYRILSTGMKVFVNLIKPQFMREWMIKASEKAAPGIWGGMLCRKRYIDDKLTETANQMEAVVNLGSGFDTRAYRLSSLSEKPYWEVDQINNIKLKEKQVFKVFGNIPSSVKMVAIDFDREDLSGLLKENGYNIKKRTFYIWEGVTQYLTEAGINATFKFFSGAAPGSRLVFTYVRKDFLDGRFIYGWEKGYNQYVKSRIWLFGMNPESWPIFLKEYGWKIIEDIGYDELSEKYIKPTGRKLGSTPIERIVYAEKL